MSFSFHLAGLRLHEFLGMYPDISVSLLLDDAELDLAMRQANVATA